MFDTWDESFYLPIHCAANQNNTKAVLRIIKYVIDMHMRK